MTFLNTIGQRLPLKQTQWVTPLAVIIVALLAFLFHRFEPNFSFARAPLLKGEIWRLLSCHFYHTNSYHLILNIVGVFGLWLANGHNYAVKNYSFCFFISALTCSIGLFLLSPGVNHYVGLSGVLHGIVIFYALQEVKQKDFLGWALLVGVIAKILSEQFFGANLALQSKINAAVIVDGHLWGAVGGAIAFFVSCYFYHNKN